MWADKSSIVDHSNMRADGKILIGNPNFRMADNPPGNLLDGFGVLWKGLDWGGVYIFWRVIPDNV